jgi:tRNA-2-methylthio-N6-dimethylallyladenosine synthase
MKEVIADFKKLIANGQKEIILLGQNVDSYSPSVISSHPLRAEPPGGAESARADDEGGEKSYSKQEKPFAVLLKTLNIIPGDFLISFTSNHPKDMSDDIIKAVATLSKVKKAIHIPLQSGSDKILKTMNRPYTREQYIELVKKIRKSIPNVTISTDVIVGFPGETEKEFEKTVSIFRELNFDAAYINKYSPRKGTAAFKLGDPIPWEEKERRWRILNDISYYKK